MYKERRCEMPEIRPIRDLRNTNEISEICHTRKEPVFITKNGYGDLVVMSIEVYDEMIKNMTIDKAISQSEAELAKNQKLYDAKEALASLKRKHLK